MGRSAELGPPGNQPGGGAVDGVSSLQETTRQVHHIWSNMLEQGPDRQRTPVCCSEGMTSMRGASESRCGNGWAGRRLLATAAARSTPLFAAGHGASWDGSVADRVRGEAAARPCAKPPDARREQEPPGATAITQKAYFVIEGRPGSQPDPHPPKESGQGTPEPVRTAEVRQRCDTQQVSVMARRERHPVAAESDTPLLIPAC
jgi:hypothetical protein